MADSDTTSSIVEFADKLRTDAGSVPTSTPPTGEQLQEVVIADETTPLRYDPAKVSLTFGGAFSDAIAKFAEVVNSLHLHAPRPRRSRQVRGKRARNYVRALARNNAGSSLNDQAERIKNEGKATGAVGDLRRHNEARAEAARKRARES